MDSPNTVSTPNRQLHCSTRQQSGMEVTESTIGGQQADFDQSLAPTGSPPAANEAKWWQTFMPWLEEERPLLPYQEAAILLEYARDGQDLNGSNLTTRSRSCYRLRHKLQPMVRTAAWGLLLIHIFERPIWTFRDGVSGHWNNAEEYPSFEIDYLDPTAVNVLALLCLAVLWLGVSLEFGYKMRTSNAYLTYWSALIVSMKTIAVIGCLIKITLGKNPNFSVSPAEALMCLLVEVQYDNNLGYIRRTVPKFGVLMLILSCFIATYTAVGFLIFNPSSEEALEFFPTVGTGIWNMLMMLNGSNWPGPILPALVSNRAYCIYFFVYIIVVGWGLLNLVLGFVYLFFQQELRGILEMQEATRVDNKAAAFRILDVEKKGFLTYTQVDELLKEMYLSYESISETPTAAERYELILVLDIQSNMMIDENDFSFIEQKCFKAALKVMRAKKRKFTRYVAANILKEQTRLSSQSRSMDKRASQSGGASTDNTPQKLLAPSAGGDGHTRKESTDSGSSGSAGGSGNYQPNMMAALARAQASALASEVGVVDSRISKDSDTNYDAPMQTRELRFSSTIEHASRYAGKIEDPKLLELYKAIETKQLEKLQQAEGLTVSQRRAFYAMQLDSIYFDIIADSFILVFGIGVLNNPEYTDVIHTYIAFSMFEMLTKLLVKGQFRYWRSNRNAVDGLITIGLLVLAIGDASVDKRAYSEVGTKTLVLLRTLLYPRNILVTNGFREFRNRHRLAFSYAFNGAGHFTFLLLVLVVMLYMFAGFGQRIFGGAITHTGPGSERIANSAFGQADYYPLNFNDMPSGMVTMFTLLSVNNMHVTTSGFVAAYSQWAEVFFACWYALGVLLLLNVLTAVFVNQFTGYMGRLAEEKRQMEEKRQAEEAQQKLLEGQQSEPGSMQSVGDLVSLRENTLRNSQLSHLTTINALHQQSGVGGPDQEDYISTPHDAPSGVFFSPVRPSMTASAAIPRRSEAPVSTPKHGVLRFGSITSTTGFGLLAKMLTVDDTPESEVYPPLSPMPGRASPASFSPYGGGSESRIGDDAPSRRGSSRSPGAALQDGRLSLSRGRASTTVITSEKELPSVAGSFNSSIFASDSGRQKLNDWVRSHYPKPRRGTATTPGGPPSTPVPFPQQAFSGSTYGTTDVALGVAAAPDPTRLRGTTYAPGASQKILSKLVVPSGTTRLSLDAADNSDDEDQTTNELFEITDDKDKSASKKAFSAPVPIKSSTGTGRTTPLTNMFGDSAKSAASPARNHAANTNTGDFEMNSVSSTESNKPSESINYDAPAAGARTQSTGGTSNPLFTASGGVSSVIHSTQEELQHLRAKKSRFLGSAPERQATQSLHEWMYGAQQISRHEKAAVLIQFARDGEEHSIFSSPRGLACFRLRTSLAPLFRLCSLVYALLKFIQRPVWTYYHDRWNDSSVYPVSGLPQLSATTIGSLKLPLLLVMLFGLLLELGYKESNFVDMFKKTNGMRVFRYILTMYCIAQIAMVMSGMAGHKPQLVTIASFGSMVYLLWFNRRSLHKFRVVLRVVPRLSAVLVVFFLLVLLFAGFGPYLFNLQSVGKDDDVNQPYFDSFGDSTWSVFVAITSSNYPNQVIPAYRKTREVFLYFFAFISLGAFCMLNLILVIVLVEFQKASQLATDIQRATCQVLLMRAYEVLDPEGVGYIEREQIRLLLDELYLHYSDFKKAGIPKGAARDILIDILDVDGDGVVNINDFLYFLDVTRIKLSKDSENTFMELYFPAVVATSAFQLLVKVVKYPYTNLAVDLVVSLMILINLFINSRNSYHQTESSVTIAFTVVEIICAEVLCKMAVLGYRGYKRSFRNRIDFAIASTALVAVIAAGCYEPIARVNGFTIIMRIALMLRLFLFPRNLRYFFESRGLKRFARLLRRILSKTLTLSIVFLCTGYVFATIGTFFYGGVINKSSYSNPDYEALMTSRYGEAGFYPLNFNDMMSASITLFCCLHVSDFDTVASGFTATTGAQAKLFFAMWYVVGVLLMLNILKSFFLGEFLSLFLVPAGAAAGADGTTKDSATGSATSETSEIAAPEGAGGLSSSAKAWDSEAPSTPAALPGRDRDSVADGTSAMRETYVLNIPGLAPAPRMQSASRTTPSFMFGVPRMSSQRMTSDASSRQVSTAHEYDEEQYKKIAFTRESVSREVSVSQSQPAANTRYFASTAKVKNLDTEERERLRQRIRSLAMSGAL